MAWAGTMRLAPTEAAMEVMVQIRAAGMLARSSSLTIVAPQRVPVPQVAVKTTPTLEANWARRSWAISLPKRVALSTVVALPAVV